MKKYGLIGKSLQYSLSPKIHNSAFNICHIDAHYQNIEINPKIFDRHITGLKAKDYSGFNITIPYKSRVMPFLDHISSDADTVGAVNTICVKNSHWYGFNTDIKGFIKPLDKIGDRLNRCLLLGSGGAARAVFFALAKYFNSPEIYIGCRNRVKGEQIKDHFLAHFDTIRCEVLDLANSEHIASSVDLIVNTTPLGMSSQINNQPLYFKSGLAPGTVVYDLIYNPPHTKLLQAAEKAGENIIILNGLEMLIAQAAGSFELWTDKKFPYEQVKKELFSGR